MKPPGGAVWPPRPWTALLIAILALLTPGHIHALASCPPESLLLPCSCTLSQIFCFTQQIVRIKPIFERIARHLNEDDVHFISLELDGLSIRHLEANFTAGLHFERIALKNLKHLVDIDPSAFTCTSATIEQFSLEGHSSQYLNDRHLPRLTAILSKMPSLRRLYVDAYHLQTLPKHFFAHNHLVDLSFNFNRNRRGRLAIIHSEAFYYLPSLRSIDLYGQQLTVLHQGTFRFQEDSRELTTSLFLQDNNLTSNSLDVGLFTDIKRQLTVHLAGNQFTTVPSEIFKPLLQANPSNMLDLSANPLVMSCTNRWIASLESRYRQFLGAIVADGPTETHVLVTLDEEDYASLHCDHH